MGFTLRHCWFTSDYTGDGKMTVKNKLEGVWKEEVLV